MNAFPNYLQISQLQIKLNGLNLGQGQIWMDLYSRADNSVTSGPIVTRKDLDGDFTSVQIICKLNEYTI